MMWHGGRESLSKKDRKLARTVKKAAPSVSLAQLPPPNLCILCSTLEACLMLCTVYCILPSCGGR
jgi:hypothetical protein